MQEFAKVRKSVLSIVQELRRYITFLGAERAAGRDIAKLIGGTISAQIIIVIATPIITRLYTPGDLGVLGVFVSVSGILGVAACMRYDLAIMLPKSDEDSINLVVSSCAIALFTSIILLVSLWMFREIGGDLFDFDLNLIWTCLVPAGVLILGIANAFSTWQSRKKQFNRLALGRIMRALVLVGSQIVLRWEADPIGDGAALITAQLVADTILVLVLADGILEFAQSHANLRSFNHYKRLIKRYKKFPFFSVWGGLFNRSAAYLPQLMFAFLFDLEVVGFLLVSQKLVGMPVSVVGEGVSRVFFQKATEYRNEGRPVHIMLSIVLIGLFILSISILGILSMAAPYLIVPLLGQEWVKVGRYIQILAPMYAFKFSASPVSQLAIVFEKQERFLLWQVAYMTVSIVSIVIGSVLGGAEEALVGYSISGCCMYAYLIGLCMKWAGGRIMEIFVYAKRGLSEGAKAA